MKLYSIMLSWLQVMDHNRQEVWPYTEYIGYGQSTLSTFELLQPQEPAGLGLVNFSSELEIELVVSSFFLCILGESGVTVCMTSPVS